MWAAGIIFVVMDDHDLVLKPMVIGDLYDFSHQICRHQTT